MKASEEHMNSCYSLIGTGMFAPHKYLEACLARSKDAYRGTTFPPKDPVLASLDSSLKRIPKLYPTREGFVEVAHSFVSGPSAALHRGIDVVYYYDPANPKSISGAVRFGLRAASIVLPQFEYAATVHGGAVEAVLDDITGTVVRHHQSVWMATSDFSAKLKKPCPLNKTLKFHASIESVEKSGLFCMCSCRIVDEKGVVIATGGAKMVDTIVLARLMAK